jgi:uncharacterized protein DUF2628
MRIYTVHEPPRRDDELVAHTARFQFVRDGFHFWAFLLAPLWMLRHRMWLEFIAYVLLVGGITFALSRLGVEESAGAWVALLLALLVGIEASSLLRWKLARRGFENLGVVVGKDLEEAERRFFDGWVSNAGRLTTPTPSQASTAASPFERPAPSPDIVGLFPQPQPQART